MSGTVRRLVRRHLPLAMRKGLGARRGAWNRSGAGPAAPTAASSRVDDLVEALRAGDLDDGGMVAEVRALLEVGQQHEATTLAALLATEPGSAVIGALTGAIVAFHRGYLRKSWAAFASVPADLRWRHAEVEYLHAGLACDRDAVLTEVRALVAERPPSVDAQGWSDILGVVFGAGDEDLTREIFAILDEQVGETGRLAVIRDWMRPWVAASGDSASAQVPAGHVSIGIMDYGHPGRYRASANIGDHIQSLASLGHLVRHQDIAFHGPDELVGLLGRLRDRVRPEIRRTGIAADVEVRTVHRDASMYQAIPPNTWMLSFGWFMHAIFEQRYGFPFHRNVLPIFLSFHCNKRDLLTEDALAYLREYGPIGCRDWTTVDILLSVDVPAFFSGCMTTTTSNVFPDLPDKPAANAPVAYVDMPSEAVPPGAQTYHHSSDKVRFRSFATNVDNAVELLETYRREHSAVATSRLHCWLPARSIGMAVDFQPKNRSDIRFAGLIDTTQTEFDRIRSGINEKLEKVVSAILSGTEPAEVYDLWRGITKADVELARERRLAADAPLPLHSGLGRDITKVRKKTAVVKRPGGADPVDVAVLVSPKRRRAVRVLLDSLVTHSSRDLRVWLVARDRADIGLTELIRLFPTLALAAVPTSRLGSTVSRGDGHALQPRDVDTLALAEILPDVDRVVLLPTDALVTGDIAELAALDLDDHLLAAPTVVGTSGSSGFGLIHSAANRLGPKTATATELRHRAYARHAFDFDAFTTSVMVLDLARMRTQRFLAEYLPYVEEFGLTARDVLHLAVGPDRAVVPERWDNVPTRSEVDGAGLLHWADPVKPWSRSYTEDQEAWLAAAEALDRR